MTSSRGAREGKPPATGRVRLLEVRPSGERRQRRALAGSLGFGRLGGREQLRVVPGRLVQAGAGLGTRLPGTGEGVAATPAAVTPVTLPPPAAGRLLPSGFAGRHRCARPLRCASSQRRSRAACSCQGALDACFQSSGRKVCDW